ncbi:hypothetical protein HPB49_021636 [Dermacentor silvarum]|uniref:Uncharacterized protein n=1 Tax=Dermacentor silvarum TaxID=543639 RepID=A0ACB8C5U8_DERSI|nr:hypothetical protein HPB49_021636 [Dermacentor silvarum]
MALSRQASEDPNEVQLDPAEVAESLRLSASAYAKHNKPQRKFNLQVLNFCQSMFREPSQENHQYLDIGCGTGDFTRDVLLPMCLPCRKIVGVDCSPEMIQHARRHSASEKLHFHVLDVCGDVSGFAEKYGHFERVYSFYCLHWALDLGAAIKNIAKLLTPTGECLLAFYACHEVAIAWKRLVKLDRWAKYSEILLKYSPQTQDICDRQEQLRFMSRLLEGAGLSPSILETVRATTFDGFSEDEIVATYMNIIPIIKLVTPEEKEELLEFTREYVRVAHAPGVDKNGFRMFIIKASKMQK